MGEKKFEFKNPVVSDRALDKGLDAFMARIFASTARNENERERLAAQLDPKGHRLSKLFQNSSYRYYQAGRSEAGAKVFFCYSCHPNAAGYYLTWRETLDGDEGHRDLWVAHKQRKVAKAFAHDCAQERKARIAEKEIK